MARKTIYHINTDGHAACGESLGDFPTLKVMHAVVSESWSLLTCPKCAVLLSRAFTGGPGTGWGALWVHAVDARVAKDRDVLRALANLVRQVEDAKDVLDRAIDTVTRDAAVDIKYGAELDSALASARERAMVYELAEEKEV